MCAIHLYADHLAHLFRNELAEMNYPNSIEQIVAYAGYLAHPFKNPGYLAE
jgi:hypothetical protein